MAAVLVLAGGGMLIWQWWEAGLQSPSFSRVGIEEIFDWAGLAVTALGALIGFLAWRRPQPARPLPVGRMVIGRLPSPATALQTRQVEAVLTATAGTGSEVRSHVLSGMGGVGKTQLAAWFARRLYDHGQVDVVVWIDATSAEAIVDGYANAAALVGLPSADLGTHYLAGRFLAWLEETNRPWLVVLDDVSSPAVVGSWWPPHSPRGRTLITTRRRDTVLHDHGQLVDVGLFTADEARRYLTERMGRDDLDEVKELAADLGYLPLALAQASAYMKERRIDCAIYRCFLAERALPDVVPDHTSLPDAQAANIAASLWLSIRVAVDLSSNGTALPVLRVASLLSSRGIPTDLFTTPSALAYFDRHRLGGPHKRPLTAHDVVDALHSLHRLNLVTLDLGSTPGQVAMHAMVQRALREGLTEEQISEAAHATADALVHLWPAVDSAIGPTLRANTAALHQHAADDLLHPKAHAVLFRAATSLGECGQVNAAIDTFRQLVDDTVSALGAHHPDTLAARFSHARWRGESGDPTGAAEALGEVLADQLRVLGPGHAATCRTRLYIAYWQGVAGDPAGAAEVIASQLNDHLRVLGADHPQTLIARNYLARFRGRAGDITGAAKAFANLLTDQIRVLGPDHPDTLATRNNLAYWQGMAGDPVRAVQILKLVLDDELRVLGPDHPQTLTTRDNLARWYGEAGNPAAAVTTLEQVLADRRRILGPDHPSTLLSRHSLGRWYGETGSPADAVATLEKVLADRLRVLGPDHPHTLITRESLAYWRMKIEGDCSS